MVTSRSEKRIRRRNRIRAKVQGTSDRPRLAISKSNKNIIAQIIDDRNNETLAYVWSKNVEGETMKDKAANVGKQVAKLAKDKKITKVVFDRGGYIYTGNVKLLADSAREAGLEF